MKTRKYLCPECLQKTGVDILYGMPTGEMFEASERGEIALGGCCIELNGPERKCTVCGCEWKIQRRQSRLSAAFDGLNLPPLCSYPPLDFSFSIGGYAGPCHSLTLEAGALRYQGSEYAYEPSAEFLISMTDSAWMNLYSVMAAASVPLWRKKYRCLQVLDGTHWALKLETPEFCLDSHGDNAYPPEKGWKTLLQELSRLTGRDIC